MLFARSSLPQLPQAFLQLAAQNGGRIGIERDEVPERLAAIAREPCQGGGVRIGVARYVFAYRGVGVLGQAAERL